MPSRRHRNATSVWTGGINFILAAIKRLHNQQHRPYTNFELFENIQSGCLRGLTPSSISNAALRSASGLIKIKAQIWQAILLAWLRIHLAPTGLLSFLISDNPRLQWWNTIMNRLTSFGLSPGYELFSGFGIAKKVNKQWLAKQFKPFFLLVAKDWESFTWLPQILLFCSSNLAYYCICGSRYVFI